MPAKAKKATVPTEDPSACAARFEEGRVHDRAIVQRMRDLLWEQLSENKDLALAAKCLPVIMTAVRNLSADSAGTVGKGELDKKVDQLLGSPVGPKPGV